VAYLPVGAVASYRVKRAALVTPFDPALIHALNITTVGHEQIGSGSADHAVLQTSTIAALLDGRYDGDVTVGELLKEGDLGVGTLNGLDGELTIVDSQAWQVGVDGAVRRVSDGELTPFAAVVRFSCDEVIKIDSPLINSELHDLLREHAPRASGCEALRIDGLFSRIHARSVPRQSPPYRGLVEVAAQQVEWTFHDLEATVVGFRFPDCASGVGVVGDHLHFISSDRRCSGHVLGCDVTSGELRIEAVDTLRIELPTGIVLPDPSTPNNDGEISRFEAEG